jgi:uncharacterized damage-inducible protein DinB
LFQEAQNRLIISTYQRRRMLPPRIAEGFKNLPDELIGLCRPHTWEQLSTPPAARMRSIRDVLVHLIDAGNFWIRHVIQGKPFHRLDPASFGDLNGVLVVWMPQREATLALIGGLTDQERASRRPLPWNSAETASVEEIVWHVVTHEQYHRGQIFTRLAMLGRRDLPDHDLLRRAPAMD